MDIRYVLNRLADMNYGALFEKVSALHTKTKKSRIFLLWDMLTCAVKYGAGYMDYDLFEMYDLTPAQRDTYITRGRNNALVKKYNDPAYIHLFDNKTEFNVLFADFLRRDWIPMNADRDQVLAFIQRHDVLIVKPVAGSCGKGVQRIVTSDYPDAQNLYDTLLESPDPLLLEEVIVQHPDVNRIYPTAINTLRAVTICHNGTAHLICTYFRIGNKSHHVDNFNSGGMVAPVDLSGVVRDKAIDKNKVLYAVHPETGATIEGFVFPDWEDAMEMVRRAALVVPQMGYVGWDVAFTPNGPCLVEGNFFPGHDIYQLPEHTPDKHGMYEKFLVE